MSWFSSSPPAAAPKKTIDGTPEAPDRSARAKCWAARDAFFACLDQNGIIDAVKESDAATKTCGMFDAQLQRDCASSWVTYFKQRRVMENKKKTILEGLEKEGAQKMPSNALPGGVPPSRAT